MKTILLIVIVLLVIYIIRSRKTNKENQTHTPPPLPTIEPDTKAFNKTVSSPKNNFNLDLNVDEEDSGKEYLVDIYDLNGVHLPLRKEYILSNCEEYDPVFLRKEPSNPVNSEAIAVYHDSTLIGYIPDVDLDEVHKYFDNISDASISEIEYDGKILRVEIDVEHEIIKRRRKKAKAISTSEDSDLHPEDFMRFAQNKISSEYLKPKKDLEDTGSYFYGKKVCISGTLDNFPYREELAHHLWELGADIDTSVGKKCSILICGEGAGPSKCKQAEEQGVHVMKEEELVEKLNGFKSRFK